MTQYETNLTSQIFCRELSGVYNRRRVIYDPDFATLSDPEILEKAMRDPVSAQAIFQRRHLVAGRDWSVQAASEEEVDKQAAKVVEELLTFCHRFVSSRYNLAGAVIRGSSWAYIQGVRHPTQVRSDDQIRRWWVPTVLRDVDRDRFRKVNFLEHRGDLPAPVWQLWSVQRERWETIGHPEHFVHLVYNDDERSLGYGQGLLRSLYLYLRAKAITLDEGLNGLERWARGMINVKVDSLRATDEDVDALVQSILDRIDRMRSRYGLVTDKDDEVEVITGGVEGWQLVKEMMAYLDASIRILILGSNLPTSATEGGSYALAEVQENSTESLIQYDRMLLEEAITDRVIRLIWRLNWHHISAMGLAGASMPSFQIDPLKREDTTEITNNVVQLTQAGVPLSLQSVYERTGWPRPGPEDEIVEPPEPAAAGGGGGFFAADNNPTWPVGNSDVDHRRAADRRYDPGLGSGRPGEVLQAGPGQARQFGGQRPEGSDPGYRQGGGSDGPGRDVPPGSTRPSGEDRGARRGAAGGPNGGRPAQVG